MSKLIKGWVVVDKRGKYRTFETSKRVAHNYVRLLNHSYVVLPAELRIINKKK